MREVGRFELDNFLYILNKDSLFKNILLKYKIVINETAPYSGFYYEVASLFITNLNLIKTHTIEEILCDNKNQEDLFHMRNSMKKIFEIDIEEKGWGTGNKFNNEIYKHMLYMAKYSTVKNFFTENYKKFLPTYDYHIISSQERSKLFIESFTKEFDRMASIIDNISNLSDVDTIPEEYLNYLAQIVGYQKESDIIFANISFRELVKNMVDIYRIKGSNYSFELFFNLLGFDISIKEYWFDRRFYDENIKINNETGVSNTNLSGFYLSIHNPISRSIKNAKRSYLVTEDQITETKNLFEFERKLRSGEANIKQLLGLDSSYRGETYTFFKTNVAEYSLVSNRPSNGKEEISATDMGLIENYARFLTPVFIRKKISVLLKPYDEDNSDSKKNITPIDTDREDPRSEKSFDESMLHTYSGYQPTRYYWDDGVNTYAGEAELKNGKAGTYVGGFYLDTEKILKNYNTYSGVHSNILEELGLGNRDVVYPFNSELSGEQGIFVNQQILGSLIYYLNNFSYIKGDWGRNSESLGENFLSSNLQKIDKDSKKLGFSKLSNLRNLKTKDKIQIIYSKQFENFEKVFTVVSITDDEIEGENIFLIRDDFFRDQPLKWKQLPSDLHHFLNNNEFEVDVDEENKNNIRIDDEKYWEVENEGNLTININNITTDRIEVRATATEVSMNSWYGHSAFFSGEYKNLFDSPLEVTNQTVVFEEEGDYWATCFSGSISCYQGVATYDTPLFISVLFSDGELTKSIPFTFTSCTYPMLEKGSRYPFVETVGETNTYELDITKSAIVLEVKDIMGDILFEWNDGVIIGYRKDADDENSNLTFYLGENINEEKKPLVSLLQDEDNYFSVSHSNRAVKKFFINGKKDGVSVDEVIVSHEDLDYPYYKLKNDSGNVFIDVDSSRKDFIEIKVGEYPPLSAYTMLAKISPVKAIIGFDNNDTYYNGQIVGVKYE